MPGSTKILSTGGASRSQNSPADSMLGLEPVAIPEPFTKGSEYVEIDKPGRIIGDRMGSAKKLNSDDQGT